MVIEEGDQDVDCIVNLAAVAALEDDFAMARRLMVAARDAAPRSLIQDAAMLDLNDIALDLCSHDCAATEAAERMRDVLETAQRTRDVRFIGIASWFNSNLQRIVGSYDQPTTALRGLGMIRLNGFVPLEIFLRVEIMQTACEILFVLSPHWRY